MPQVRQAPGPLDIGIVPGDDMSFIIHPSTSLAAYTLSSVSGDMTLSIAQTEGMAAGLYYTVTITRAQSAQFTEDREWELVWIAPGDKRRTFGKGNIRIIR